MAPQQRLIPNRGSIFHHACFSHVFPDLRLLGVVYIYTMESFDTAQ